MSILVVIIAAVVVDTFLLFLLPYLFDEAPRENIYEIPSLGSRLNFAKYV